MVGTLMFLTILMAVYEGWQLLFRYIPGHITYGAILCYVAAGMKSDNENQDVARFVSLFKMSIAARGLILSLLVFAFVWLVGYEMGLAVLGTFILLDALNWLVKKIALIKLVEVDSDKDDASVVSITDKMGIYFILNRIAVIVLYVWMFYQCWIKIS